MCVSSDWHWQQYFVSGNDERFSHWYYNKAVFNLGCIMEDFVYVDRNNGDYIYIADFTGAGGITGIAAYFSTACALPVEF